MHEPIGLTVRVLSPDDWPLWRSLRLAALREAPDAFGATLAYWEGEGDAEWRWRDRLTAVPLNVVAELRGEPVGMASGLKTEAAVQLISMWVAPSARGQGVADRLVQAVAEWARSLKVERLTLSVRAKNAPGIALYARHGFVDAGASPETTTGEVPERWMVRELP